MRYSFSYEMMDVFTPMDFNFCQSSVEGLNESDPENLLQSIKQLKNAVIGSNRKKLLAVECKVIPRLLHILTNENSSPELLTECGVVLGSLARGTTNIIQQLVDENVTPILLQGLGYSHLKFVEACLQCLMKIFTSPVAPIDLLFQDMAVIPQLLEILPRSLCTQECVANILSVCCQTSEQQQVLCNCRTVEALTPLLTSTSHKVQLPTLECFAALCYQNSSVSLTFAKTSYEGTQLTQIFSMLQARDKPPKLQLAAAKCLTYMCRASALSCSDPIIETRTLSTLIRMCRKEQSTEERVSGAETLAYLIEVDKDLQYSASHTDHLIKLLADYLQYFRWPSPTANGMVPDLKTLNDDIKKASEMKQAAFKAYASLSANDENIRKKIIETENFMDYVVNGLSDSSSKVQYSALRCLHSLSRSVHQLRTSFSDHSVWKPLMALLQLSNEEILLVSSSILCNLLLEFSPSKEHIIEQGIIEMICSLTKKENLTLELNGIWALMNMSFQADQKVKVDILNYLGTEHLFRLLSDSSVEVVMKTLGLLRNLLTNRSHIDHIMSVHGNQVMQAVILMLEGEHPPNVKEQTLCILSNVADGISAKEFIISNEDVLKKIIYYMNHMDTKLQISATFCVLNLIRNEDEGAVERQGKLRDLGVQKLLQQLLSSSDPALFDKVKTALQQFTT